MGIEKTADDVVAFWFEEIHPKQHFIKDEQFDSEIKRRFLPLYESLRRDPSNYLANANTMLAAILVFDQFSRNMFRGTAKAFATDGLALKISRQLVASGEDRNLSKRKRIFAYMPFMHSENLADQEESILLYKQLGEEKNLEYAIEHRDVIHKFGRFPHRNEALGRSSTEEEQVFVNTPGTGF